MISNIESAGVTVRVTVACVSVWEGEIKDLTETLLKLPWRRSAENIIGKAFIDATTVYIPALWQAYLSERSQ